MILSTGVMRAIARSHPTIALDVLASPANAAILDGADYVAQRHRLRQEALGELSADGPRGCARARYDAVIDCMVTAPVADDAAAGVRQRGAVSRRHRRPRQRRGLQRHRAARPRGRTPTWSTCSARSARHSTSTRATARSDRVLDVTDAERDWAESVWGSRRTAIERRVLVNVSAGTQARLWADANYVAVLRHLRQRHPAIEARVIGAPASPRAPSSIAADGRCHVRAHAAHSRRVRPRGHGGFRVHARHEHRPRRVGVSHTLRRDVRARHRRTLGALRHARGERRASGVDARDPVRRANAAARSTPCGTTCGPASAPAGGAG